MCFNYQRILGTTILAGCLGLFSFGQNNMITKVSEIGFSPNTAYSTDASAILPGTPTTNSEDIVSVGSHLNKVTNLFDNVVVYQDSTYDEGRQHKIFFNLPPSANYNQLGTAVSNGPFGNYWVGHSMIVNGTEYCYLVKVDPSGTPLYAHVYGKGHIKEIEYHVQSDAMIVYGHNANGNLFVMSLDPNPGSTLTNDYNWGWELESYSSGVPARQTAHDMAIEPNDAEIVLQGTSQDVVTNDQDVCVWRFRSDGVLQWQFDYGQPNSREQARGICIGPGGPAGPPYNLVMAINRAANFVVTKLDPNNGLVIGVPQEYSNPNGVRLQPQDIEYSVVNNRFYVCGGARSGANRDGMVVPIEVSLQTTATTFSAYSTVYTPVFEQARFAFNKVLPEPSGNICFSGSAYHSNTGGFAGGFWLLRTNPLGQDPTMCSTSPLIDAAPYVLPTDTRIEVINKDISLETAISGGPMDVEQGGACELYAFKDAHPSPGEIAAESGSNMTLFPNPANSHVQVQLSSDVNETWEVQLLDITGRNAKQTLQASNGNLSVDISELPAGMYFVRATNGSDVHVQQLIVE